jgi:hypothetical protein
MEIQGTVTKVNPVQVGNGKNGEWRKQEIIIEVAGKYPKNVCLSLWGDKTETVRVGQTINASINLESREYNGRWYTEARVWKIDGQAQQESDTYKPSTTEQNGSDSLPF